MRFEVLIDVDCDTDDVNPDAVMDAISEQLTGEELEVDCEFFDMEVRGIKESSVE